MYKQTLTTVITVLLSLSTYAQLNPLGGCYITSGQARDVYVSVKNEDSVYVVYKGTGTVCEVQRFDDTGWVDIGNLSTVWGTGMSKHILKQGAGNTLFLLSENINDSGKLGIAKYSNGSWDTVGNTNFSGAYCFDKSLIVNSNNTPIISFESLLSGNKAHVMQYNGSNWTTVGSNVFNNATVNLLKLTSNSDDTLYIAAESRNGGGGTKVWVKKYTGSSWVVVGGGAAYADNVQGLDLAIGNNDSLYLAYVDEVINKITVIKYNGSGWDTVGAANFTTGDAKELSLAVDDSTGNLYVAYKDQDSSNRVRMYYYNGSVWTALNNGLISTRSPISMNITVDEYGAAYLSYTEYVNSQYKSIVQKYTDSTTWNGSTWTNGNPGERKSAFINSSTAPSGFSCLNLNINSGYSLNTATNSFNIYGDVTNNGNALSGTGTLNFTGDDTSQLYGDTLSHEGTITVASGATLATNGLLRLSSNASNHGRIANSAGSITGDVIVERYMTAKRAFRFLGHPFSSAIAMSQLTDDIDVTGNGGATNGFTTTGSNNPSVYIWDVDSADNSTAGNNPGWQAVTSASANSWDKSRLARVLVRGTKGQGLAGGSYTPSAVTIDMVGEVNQGTQVITLTKGSNSNFVSCANPYPCPVQTNLIGRGSNVGSNYYIWDATSGTKGAYLTLPFSFGINLPACAAFFTTVSANTNNTITFEEADKTTGAPVSVFKGTSESNWVELNISDSTTKWDQLLINLNSNGMEVEDKLDAKKLYNPGLDFFTLSKDEERLAIDVRPYNNNESISLGLTAYNRYNRYAIRTGRFNIPSGAKLILHDKYLNKKEELKTGFEYWFDVTSDTASQGNHRFEINMVGQLTSIIQPQQSAQIQLIPNPAHDEVKLSFNKLDSEANITLMSITGSVIYQATAGAKSGSVTIPLTDIPQGIYIVELRSKNVSYTEKLIKE